MTEPTPTPVELQASDLDNLFAAIAACAPHASKDGGPPILCHVSIESPPDSATSTVVATDGYTMATTEVEIPASLRDLLGENLFVASPVAAMKAYAKWRKLLTPSCPVLVSMNDRRRVLTLAVPSAGLPLNLEAIDAAELGDFPRWRGLVPASFSVDPAAQPWVTSKNLAKINATPPLVFGVLQTKASGRVDALRLLHTAGQMKPAVFEQRLATGNRVLPPVLVLVMPVSPVSPVSPVTKGA